MTDQPRANGPEFLDTLHCHACGAANDPGSAQCWRCGRRDWNQPRPSPWGAPRAETKLAPNEYYVRASKINPVSVIYIAFLLASLIALAIAMSTFDRPSPLGLVLVPGMVPIAIWGFRRGNRVLREQPPMTLCVDFIFTGSYIFLTISFCLSLLLLIGLAGLIALFLICLAGAR